MPLDEMHQRIRLQAVLDTAVDGIILIDADGSILTFNLLYPDGAVDSLP